MDNTIAGKYISFDYIWDTSVVLDFDIVTALHKGNFLPTKGFHIAFALLHCCSRKLAGDNMPGKNIGRCLIAKKAGESEIEGKNVIELSWKS